MTVLSERIEHGKDGFLVEPGDVQAHSGTLVQLDRDPALRQQIGEAAWRKVRARYTCERERTEFRGILGLDGSQEDQRNPQSVHAVRGR
ncbi:MAG: glycosyltransferase [Acidobacteria bacterium]|nr:glycosyltransferase [Acidobacteriota bacterium]